MSDDPRLPYELERHIMEVAALSYRADALFQPIAELLLVAQRVKAWIEPILYGVVVCSPFPGRAPRYIRPPLDLYIPTLLQPTHDDDIQVDACKFDELPLGGPPTSSGPRTSKTLLVRHILLQIPSTNAHTTNAARILSECTTIQNVALWTMDHTAYTRIQPYLAKLHLRRLNIALWFLMGETPPREFIQTHPVMFAHLTHLHLHHLWDLPDPPEDLRKSIALWKALEEEGSKVTHLALDIQTAEIAFAALDTMTRLELVVSIFPGPLKPEREDFGPGGLHLTRYDPRLVFIYSSGTYQPLFGDWERGALGGEDVWIKAERIREMGMSYEEQIARASQQMTILE